MTVRTRFAPSPTGELHLGNARTAVFNWALARRHRGAFVVRFEDTDVARHDEAAAGRILEGLDWLGLTADEGPAAGGPHAPYRQSERLPLYRAHAERLLEQGAAYHCYCTPEELAARRREARERGERPGYDGRCRDLVERERERLRASGREPSVRFRIPDREVTLHDRVRGRVTFDADEIGDPVVLRSDGRPTYNFAVVVDDHLMEVTHVVRGVDHLANTPTQLLLYAALEADPPQIAHVPLVLAPGGGGLSKREGARGLLGYREEGYHPDAVVNYLSLLGWSSPSGDEFLPRERIVAEIDLDRVGSADTEIDPEKMRWLSGRHIAAESIDRLAERLAPFIEARGLALDARERRALAEIARDRVQLLTEAAREAAALFAEPEPAAEAAEALRKPAARSVLGAAMHAMAAVDDWSRSSVRDAVACAREQCEASGADFYHPLRAALTGALEGPEFPDVVYLLGAERVLGRLRRALARSEAE